jgi:hypothetical protein
LAVLPAIEWEDRTPAQVLKRECVRAGTPLSLDHARRLVEGYVERLIDFALGYPYSASCRA